MRTIRHFFRSIAYIFYWLPVLWRDYWWDGTYILKLLRHKLAYNARAFRKWGMTMDREETAQAMENLVEILDRLIADAYATADLMAWSEKWGEMVWEPVGQGSYEFVGFENEKTPEDAEQCYREARDVDTKYTLLRGADLEELFGQLRDHLDEWWD